MPEESQNKPGDPDPDGLTTIREEALEIVQDEHKLNSVIEDLERKGDWKELLDALRCFESGFEFVERIFKLLVDYLYDRRAEQRGALIREQLLSIDLSQYDRLRTYPTGDGRNWPLERSKVLFLQAAVAAAVPWLTISPKIRPYFGQTLNPPFVPICEPFVPDAFQPPVYDLSRHTPDEWASEADAAWRTYRDDLARSLKNRFESLLAAGEIKRFDRPRRTKNASVRKAPIIPERVAYEMAAKHFFRAMSWSELAEQYPPDAGWIRSPSQKAEQKRKRAHHIQRRVQSILARLGLAEIRQ